MAKPLQTKEAKPKEEENAKSKVELNPNVLMVANTVVTIVILGIFMVIMYSMFDSMMTKKLAAINKGDDTAIEQTEENPVDERGILLDLGDFILNLADTSPRRYLKVNVAMELSKTEDETAMLSAPQEKKSGHGEAAPNPMDAISGEMEQYKPAIRDAVISVLSSKTADELSTATGKELAKEEIQQMVNSVFDGNREVLRVSFGQFIIQ